MSKFERATWTVGDQLDRERASLPRVKVKQGDKYLFGVLVPSTNKKKGVSTVLTDGGAILQVERDEIRHSPRI